MRHPVTLRSGRQLELPFGEARLTTTPNAAEWQISILHASRQSSFWSSVAIPTNGGDPPSEGN
jgi:hypothetical protein